MGLLCRLLIRAVTQEARMQTDNQVDLVRAMLAIIDRPSPRLVDFTTNCPCRYCSATRRAGFSCSVCGYRGEPFVYGCNCEPAAAKDLAYYSSHLAQLDRLGRDAYRCPAGIDWKRDELEQQIAREHERLVIRQAIGRCDASDRASGGDDCLHGLVECPTCGYQDDYSAEHLDTWARVRGVRELLRQFLRD